jgi:DNA-binding XRE family transcriptional regulator
MKSSSEFRTGGEKMNTIKERVAAYLARTGRTKAELANDLGMSRTSLHAKLNGQTDFTLCEGYKLKNILGCTADELFESTESNLVAIA